MAIIINMGQRGFVLKEGFLKPGDQITVEEETAQTLTKAYPNELKRIVVDVEKVKEVVKEPVKEPETVQVVEETTEEPKAEETAKPAKKGGRRKKAK